MPPMPKDPATRARRNRPPELRVVPAEPAPQPPLPTFSIREDGDLIEFRWPPQTQEWWAMWGRSPLAPEFTENDWSELMDAARIHAALWNGDLKLAAELRLRVAKFGATPEDRARLRITFAQAAEADTKSGTRYSSAPPEVGPRLVNE